MSESTLIYSSDMMGIPDLHIVTDQKMEFYGWLMFKHPDGQLVSLADLKPYIGTVSGNCEWQHDGEMWDTDCGTGFHFEEGGLKENNMNYCHKCGRTIIDTTIIN